ncbi:hypothetical protein MUK42_13086 [Musa troglodytarum]|uniref:Uncharacterized protein n=1 Tax=Musa troglodytarum TaxID=320322 RepID=A0A9E7HC66_9LILI|nr:hypothetical protein MUK42_13086 [Musa troglodytarum]
MAPRPSEGQVSICRGKLVVALERKKSLLLFSDVARHMGTIYLLDIHSKCKQPHDPATVVTNLEATGIDPLSKMLRLDPCKRVTAQQTDSGAQEE